jgi:hypothetical protein
MPSAPDKLLASIPKLLEAADAAALVELEDHTDKKVKKAVRRALHRLRSQGVEIPEKGRSWATQGEQLRAALEPFANVDVWARPGGAYMTLSLPDDDDGSTLFEVFVEPSDAISACEVYFQTDGQRARFARNLERDHGKRSIPADWVRRRIRWARECTVANGRAVPAALDQFLSRLGEPVDERPGCFLTEALIAGQDEGAQPEVDLVDALVAGRVNSWPPLLDAPEMVERWSEAVQADAIEIDPDAPDADEAREKERAHRISALREASKGDEQVREALQGPLANALEDAAVGLWRDERSAEARSLLALAGSLRGSEAPETVEGVEHILHHQVVSLVLWHQAQANASQNA